MTPPRSHSGIERLQEFLRLVATAEWRQPPQVWNEQLREALSDHLVKIGFGGILRLTEAGKNVIAPEAP